jgi:hypothetical protein
MRNTTTWREHAQSLPEHVRVRYGGYFETAERWELMLDALIELWTHARRGIEKVFQTLSGAHRGAH